VVCLPERNEKDLDELPDQIREQMHLVPVDRIDKVFEVAFDKLEGNEIAENKKKTIA
jgi:ATP-dependent Lon protease